MADPDDATIADDLQFERAEFQEPAPERPACAACKRPIPDAYYTINGTVLCRGCQGQVVAQWKGGSRLGRFLKASLLGIGASIVGFAIYFGVLKITGLEIGLISIVVGLLVGGAVRKGSGGRGGFPYQALAILLTYSSIAVSYGGIWIPMFFNQAKEQAEGVKKPGAVAGAAPAAGPADAAKVADPAKPADGDADDDEDRPAVAPGPPTPAEFIIAIGLLIGLIYAMPIVTGFHNPIGLLIIAFALWEAWKINKKARLDVLGPYAVGPGPDRAAAHA